MYEKGSVNDGRFNYQERMRKKERAKWKQGQDPFHISHWCVRPVSKEEKKLTRMIYFCQFSIVGLDLL